MLRPLIDRSLQATADVSVQLADLVVFLGYFAFCLYIGGLAYAQAYNDMLRMAVLDSGGIGASSVLFLGAVFGTSGSLMMVAVVIVVLAFVFFLIRFVFRLWFAMLVALTTFTVTALVAGVIGAQAGKQAAVRDLDPGQSNLPQILIDDATLPGLSDDGDYRLLRDSGSVLLFTDINVGGQSEIFVVQKSTLPYYRIVTDGLEDLQ